MSTNSKKTRALESHFIRPLFAVIMILLLTIAIMPLPTVIAIEFPTTMEGTRVAKWWEDLDYLAKELPKKHKNIFFQTTKDRFEAEIKALKSNIPSMTDTQVTVELMKIVASIGDSHTSLYFTPTVFYPFSLYWFKSGIHVLATVKPYERILHTRLVRINGRDIEEITALISALISHENEAQLKNMTPNFLASPDILCSLDIMDKPEETIFTFEDESGALHNIEIKPITLSAQPEWVRKDQTNIEPPLYLKKSDPYWYQYLPENKTLYICYNSCREMKSKPFKTFAAECMEYVENGEVERLVIDLRNNGGGNSVIFQPLIDKIKKAKGINKEGRLFVIIGRRTFSSAILNAITLKQQTEATFLGEPTGGKPNHYGEVKTLTLKNSGLTVSYSTKYFRLSKEDTLSFNPDILIEPTIEAYLQNKDPVMEYILQN